MKNLSILIKKINLNENKIDNKIDNKDLLKAGLAGVGTLGGVTGALYLANKLSPSHENPVAHHLNNTFAEILANQ